QVPDLLRRYCAALPTLGSTSIRKWSPSHPNAGWLITLGDETVSWAVIRSGAALSPLFLRSSKGLCGREVGTLSTSDGVDNDLVVAVEKLSVVHNRYDAQYSDSSGTSTGDDGEDADKLNYPQE